MANPSSLPANPLCDVTHRGFRWAMFSSILDVETWRLNTSFSIFLTYNLTRPKHGWVTSRTDSFPPIRVSWILLGRIAGGGARERVSGRCTVHCELAACSLPLSRPGRGPEQVAGHGFPSSEQTPYGPEDVVKFPSSNHYFSAEFIHLFIFFREFPSWRRICRFLKFDEFCV